MVSDQEPHQLSSHLLSYNKYAINLSFSFEFKADKDFLKMRNFTEEPLIQIVVSIGIMVALDLIIIWWVGGELCWSEAIFIKYVLKPTNYT